MIGIGTSTSGACGTHLEAHWYSSGPPGGDNKGMKHIEYVYPGYSSGGYGHRPSDAAEREVRPKN